MEEEEEAEAEAEAEAKAEVPACDFERDECFEADMSDKCEATGINVGDDDRFFKPFKYLEVEVLLFLLCNNIGWPSELPLLLVAIDVPIAVGVELEFGFDAVRFATTPLSLDVSS